VDISARIQSIRKRVERAARSVDVVPSQITIIAVTKGVQEELILKALGYGISDIGENRVQGFCAKYLSISDKARWHFIGTLQTNKVKHVIDKAHLIHSLDRLSLAEEIETRAKALGKLQQALVQVNVSGEISKHGMSPDELIPFIERMQGFKHLFIKGLMTIAPVSKNTGDARFCFSRLKELFEKVRSAKYPNVDMVHLSMGMSDDFEDAILEGSNMIRIGRAIFVDNERKVGENGG